MEYGAMAHLLGHPEKSEYQAAAELGLDGVELVFRPPPEDNLIWTAEGAAETRAQAQAAGVEVPSLCAGYYNQCPLAGDDAEVRESGVQVLLNLIDRAAEVGARNILIAFFGPGEIKEPSHEDHVVAAMERCAPKAEERGVTLALETTLPAARFRALLERIDHPAARIYYDLANPVMWGAAPEDELRVLGELVAQIHIKDRAADHANVPLGEGELDYPAVVRAIRGIGYDGYLVLETPGGEDSLAATRANLTFIREQMGG